MIPKELHSPLWEQRNNLLVLLLISSLTELTLGIIILLTFLLFVKVLTLSL